MCLLEMVSFNNHPGPQYLNENDDDVRTLWRISATCNPSNDVYNNTEKTGETPYTVACQTCAVVSNNNPGLLYLSGI
jgi:hypothetical protein